MSDAEVAGVRTDGERRRRFSLIFTAVRNYIQD
jgi:hypothetical protein